MRILYASLLVSLSGCAAAPSAQTLPMPAAEIAKPAAPSPTPPVAKAAPDGNARRQARLIEALVRENEALIDRLKSAKASAPVVEAVPSHEKPPVAPELLSPAITPDATGVIDLAGPAPDTTEANPFLVRPSGENRRELNVHVSGIVAGSSAFALVNDRVTRPGDAVDVLTVESVESDAVLLRLGEKRVRLNVSPKPVRVYLPN
jgi:hypothetical protein